MTIQADWATRQELKELQTLQGESRERLAALEGRLGAEERHLATSAELHQLETTFEKRFNRLYIVLTIGFFILLFNGEGTANTWILRLFQIMVGN